MDTKAGRKDAETWPNSRGQMPHLGSEPPNAPPGPVPAVYRFAGFTLDTRRQLLVRGTEQMRLRPRTYDVLAYLLMHAGRLVGKPELMDAVWDDVAVTDDSLVQCLMEIRRALGESHDIVKTIRGRGYLLDGDVHAVDEDDVEPRETVSGRVGAGDTSPRVVEAVPGRPRFRARYVAAALLGVGIVAAVSWFQLRGADAAFAPAPTVPIRSLAVLPLENLSRDPEQEYFADGMTDELITQLAKIRALRVISRTSVMRFKSARKPLAEIARELHVDALVEGTVVRSGERVRVTAQVIQANPEMHLWAERYDRSLGDSVTMQGELAREIARAIRVKLTPQEQNRLSDVRRMDREAYEALLKGRFYWNKRTEAATQEALAYFQQAIERDPTNALAFTGLADAYASLALTEALQESLAPRDAFPKARAAVDRALQIDDTLAETHASLGHIKFQYERDWAGAETEFKRAIELNPNYANAHHWYALCLMWMGRLDQALDEINRARELDPLLLAINANVGFILAGAHQYDQAIDQLRKTLDMEPNFAHAHYRLGQIHVLKGDYADAIPELKRAIALSGGSPRATAELGLAHALLGNKREALTLLSDLKELSKRRYVSPFNFALIYGALDERDLALKWLETAYEERASSLNLLKMSPAFDGIRSDSRFTALVRRVGLGP